MMFNYVFMKPSYDYRVKEDKRTLELFNLKIFTAEQAMKELEERHKNKFPDVETFIEWARSIGYGRTESNGYTE